MAEEKKILLIEDDAMLVKPLIRLFKMQGYEVDNAQTGTEALALTRNKDYDLLITDLKLSGTLDGLATIKKVRDENAYSGNVIVISGYRVKNIKEQNKDLKIDSCFHKPFNVEEFLSHVQELLQ